MHTLVVFALLVHVEVLGLLRPQRASVEAAGGTVQLGAAGDRLLVDGAPHAGPLRLEPGRQGDLRVTVPGLPARSYPGALAASARGGRLLLELEAPLDDYVAGVVAAELGPRPEPAAAEALAVVARSFALRRSQDQGSSGRSTGHAGGAPLCDQTHCQLFQGEGHAAALRAVAATRGQVLLGSAGGVAPALHHAACGGRTQAAERLWPRASADEREAGVPVDDPLPTGPGPACAAGPGDPPLRSSLRLSEPRLAAILGLHPPLQLTVDRADDGTVLRVASRHTVVTAEELHLRLGRALGWGALRSPRFTLAELPPPPGSGEGRTLLFGALGHGHGVGLCQRGAAALARTGYTSPQILARYFPRLRVGVLPRGPDPR